ncbi:hypothetical protein LCGC14_2123160, partial [marine sediment metagenome]
EAGGYKNFLNVLNFNLNNLRGGKDEKEKEKSKKLHGN